MSTQHFLLTSGDKGNFQDGPVPAFVRIPLDGHSTKTVKKKAEVFPGMLVAEHKNGKVADAFASIAGVVTEVTETYVAIKAQAPAAPAEGEEPAVTEAAPVSLAGLEGDALTTALKGLGIDTRPLRRKCDTLIINGLNPEPGLVFAESLLAEYKEVLETGLAVLKRISPAGQIVFAVPEGTDATFTGASTVGVNAVYPNSCPELLAARVIGSERLQGVHVLDLHTLFNLGRAADTGTPLTETVVTVQGVNTMLAIGTPVGAVLEHAGLSVEDGDSIILGGPMRGEATCDLDRGIGAETTGVFLIKRGTFPPVEDHACISCGECLKHCPSRINPSLIGRYAEFSMLELCKAEHIDVCMECGLCAYYCVARRPMLQYIRLAKHQIALDEAQVAECALQGEEA